MIFYPQMTPARAFPATSCCSRLFLCAPLPQKACRGLLVCRSMEPLPEGLAQAPWETVTFPRRPWDDSAFTVVCAPGPVSASLCISPLWSPSGLQQIGVRSLFWLLHQGVSSFLAVSEKPGLRPQLHRGKLTREALLAPLLHHGVWSNLPQVS